MPDPATATITRATTRDLDSLSDVLARAFLEDPVLGWVIPSPSRREELLPGVFSAFAELYLPYQETYMVGGGAAMWAPVGSQPFDDEELGLLGRRLHAVLGEQAEKAIELDERLEENHPDEPACFLQFMGVVPEQQGRGLGSRLLTTVLDECDTTGTPALLDATSPDNRRLYERHGFEIIARTDISEGPSLWTMWRDPSGSTR